MYGKNIGDAMVVLADLAFMALAAMLAVMIAIFVFSSPLAILATMFGGGLAGLWLRRIVLPD